MSVITIQIPDFLRHQVERSTVQNSKSVDHFFVTAASEKLAVLEAVNYLEDSA